MIASEQRLPLGAKITSAKGNEPEQVKVLIQEIEPLLPFHRIVFLEADKGYDSRELRVQLLMMGIYPLIPYRGKGQRGSRWIKRIRWRVERAISWLKRCYRRIATRWERLIDAYSAIVLVGLCFYWCKKIVG